MMVRRASAATLAVGLGLLAGCEGSGGGPGTPDAQADLPSGDPGAKQDAKASDTKPEVAVQDAKPPQKEVVQEVANDVGPTGPDLPAADPTVCTGNTSGALQPAGGSCCYTGAEHATNPNCVWYEEATWKDGLCMDSQCEKGTECYYGGFTPGHCVRPCTYNPVWDATNNATGQKGADGIVDDLYPNDCGGMADGPFGTQYRCVNLSAPNKNIYSVCRPGTTFAKCNSTDDCPAEEVCMIMYLLGEWGGRCQPRAKETSDPFGPCNYDPKYGPLQFCAGGFCSLRYSTTFSQCAAYCGGDQDCATDTCTAGTCAKSGAPCSSASDCSAWECKTFDYLDNYTDEWCWPRNCVAWNGCTDPDYFCRPFWNGGASTPEDVAAAPQCRPLGEDVAAYGEPCGTAPDGTEYPDCAWAAGCIDNTCSGPCQSDSQCPAGAECLLGDEWDIDITEDDVADTYLNIDACVVWDHDGDLTACTTDADCAAGHHCEFRVKGQGEGKARVWEVEYKCKKDRANELAAGSVCGGDTGKSCESGLCLVGGTVTDAMCVAYCDGKQDCPETIDFGGFSWKSICVSFLVDHANTPSGVDDVYVPYCWRTSSFGTAEPCDEHRACPVAANRCRALAIAGNADQAVTVEHLCVDASEGLKGVPSKRTGEPCDKWEDCFGRMCLDDHDATNATFGYCSELCALDEDCGSDKPGVVQNLRCTDYTLIARSIPELSGKTKRCVVQEACALCDTDEDCGGAYRCANMGTLADNADFRCAQTCSVDGDCPAPTDTCLPSLDATGKDLGYQYCQPVTCE